MKIRHWLVRLLSGTPIKSKWKSGGVDREVVTYQQPGETSAHWAHRHIDDLIAALAIYPPDAQHTTTWLSGTMHSYTTSSVTALADQLATYPPES